MTRRKDAIGFGPEAIRLAESGITQPEIAEALNCTNRTISRWALKYPDFRAALDRGIARHNAEVRAAEMAPARAQAAALREQAASLRRLIAAVDEPAAPDEPVSVPAAQRPPQTPPRPAAPPSDAARPPRHVARYVPLELEPEPDAFDGEPLPLDDPRAGW